MGRIFLLLVFIPTVLSAQFKNIVVAEEKDGSILLDPNVVIDPGNNKYIVIGISPDKSVYSSDQGVTWKESTLKSSYGVIGSPFLVTDEKNNVHFFHLSNPGGHGSSDENWLDRISVQKSSDHGATWSAASYSGLDEKKDNFKPAASAHPRKDLIVMTWTQFDKIGSNNSDCQSNIVFSKSTSKGEKWSDPVRVNSVHGGCIVDHTAVMGGFPAVSADDKIYVVWAHNGMIYLDRSFDEGRTWLRGDLEIAKQFGGWDFPISGTSGSKGLPVVAIDNSTSPFRGSLYIVWADHRNGEADADIYMVRSPNRGDNWNTPIRINQDSPGKHQFRPWITVDQAVGVIYVVYYDRRDHANNQTDVYIAWSVDGGNKFSEKKISETPFTPDESKDTGSYIGIAAHKGIIVPVWTRMDDGKTKIVATVIKQDELIKK